MIKPKKLKIYPIKEMENEICIGGDLIVELDGMILETVRSIEFKSKLSEFTVVNIEMLVNPEIDLSLFEGHINIKMVKE